MKKDIHPAYYPRATIQCACGGVLKVGATKEKINIEICSKCHPFYTGTKQLIDIAGRAERFRKRREKAKPEAITKSKVMGKKSKIQLKSRK